MHLTKHKRTVLEAYNTVALQSMTDAADELKENMDEQGISDVTVSCDGFWQKQGHSSLNGVVTVISIVSQQRYVKYVNHGKVIKVLRSMNYFCHIMNVI